MQDCIGERSDFSVTMDTSKELSSADFEQWKKRRKKVMTIYTGASLLSGMIMNGYYSTIYGYIQQIVGEKNTEYYYSIILGTGMTFGAISSLLASIYYDFTKNVKESLMFSVFLIVLGNLMYLLPYSIYLVMFGYAFILCQSICVIAMVAEINHIVLPENLISAFGRIVALRSIGLLIGPCLALAYANVDVEIGTLKLNAGNFPAVVYGTVGILFIFVLFFSLENVAKQYDLKSAHLAAQQKSSVNVGVQNIVSDVEVEERIGEEKNIDNMDACEVNKKTSGAELSSNIWCNLAAEENSSNVANCRETVDAISTPQNDNTDTEVCLSNVQVNTKICADNYQNKDSNQKKSLKLYFAMVRKILFSRSYLILWITSIIPTYTHFLVLSLLSVYVYETLDGGIQEVSYAFMTVLVGGIVSTFAVSLITRCVRDVWLAVVEIIVSDIPVILLLAIPYVKSSTFRYVLFYTAAFLNGVVDTACDILSTVMVGKIVQPEYQGIGESVRLLGFYIAYTLSSFGTGVIFKNMIIGGSVVCGVNLMMALLLIFSRKRYY